MNDIVVCQAVPSDIEALVPLFDSYRQFYGREADVACVRDFLLARFSQADSTLFIARESGAAIGFAQLYPSFSSVSLARTFILNDLFVHDGHRNKGVAKRLISAAIAYAKARGALRLTLNTAVDNRAAQRLYRACGWKRDEQFLVYHYAL